jgi:hypothetical protein
MAAAFALAVAGRAGALPPASDPPKPAIEPAAMSALKAMRVYLRHLKSFQVETKTTVEEVRRLRRTGRGRESGARRCSRREVGDPK